jgi:hypothetical protein
MESPQKGKRVDQLGNEIRKGGKKHRIVFADKSAEKLPLEQVYIVESYKKYNGDISESTTKNCCVIF